MDIDLDALAAQIGRRHGLKLDKDDPIMIAATAIAMLEGEALQHKEVALAGFVSTLEAFMTRYNQNTKETCNKMLKEASAQAQSIVNKILKESKEALQEAVEQAVQTKTANIKGQLEPLIERVRYAANMSLIAASVAVLAAGTVLWASL